MPQRSSPRSATVVGALLAVLAVPAGPVAPAAAGAGRPAPVPPSRVGPDPRFGTYAWPVHGPVIRGFEPPEAPFGPGHRGIDIAVPAGSPVRAAQDGSVAFAGFVGGSLYVSVDHPDGVRTTYSWLSGVAVDRGTAVRRGQELGTSGAGHAGLDPPHLHFGARIGETYIDPMLLLGKGSLVGLIHLAPLGPPGPAPAAAASPGGPLGPGAREPPPGVGA